MKIAVTGANGMLGEEMVKTLGERHEMVPFPRHSELDLADFQAVRNFVKQTQPDVIIHCAGFRDLDPCELNPMIAWQNNAVATFCITLAAREFGCVVVYSGSDSVFPGEREEPYHEFDPVGPPNSVYGYSKLAAENTIRQYLQKYFVLRLPWLFGRTGGPAKNWVVQLFQKVKAGQTVTAARDQLATVVYTVDVALAVRKMLETEFYGVYHIVSPGPVTRAGMHRHALEQAGYDLACLQEISINDLKRPAKRPHCNLLKSILLEPVFGIRIPPWEGRFDECISELKAAGWVGR